MTISKTTKGNNQKVYVILFLVFVIFIVSNTINNNNINNSDKHSNYNKAPEVPRKSGNETNIKSSESNKSILSHLRNHSFSVNGNGNAYFYINSKKAGNSNTKGTVTVSGGSATLQGEISILTDNSLMIYNLKAVSGSYDASINAGSTGVFYLRSNGNLEGNLSAGGESRRVKFIYKN